MLIDWAGFSQQGLLGLAEAELPKLVELGLVGMQGIKDEVIPSPNVSLRWARWNSPISPTSTFAFA